MSLFFSRICMQSRSMGSSPWTTVHARIQRIRRQKSTKPKFSHWSWSELKYVCFFNLLWLIRMLRLKLLHFSQNYSFGILSLWKFLIKWRYLRSADLTLRTIVVANDGCGTEFRTRFLCSRWNQRTIFWLSCFQRVPRTVLYCILVYSV